MSHRVSGKDAKVLSLLINARLSNFRKSHLAGVNVFCSLGVGA